MLAEHDYWLNMTRINAGVWEVDAAPDGMQAYGHQIAGICLNPVNPKPLNSKP